MRKKIGPIIIIVLSLFLAAVFGVLLTNNYVNALEEFPNDGYILVANKDNSSDAINDQRYFESGTTYKKAYDGSIVFNDINDDKVSIDSKNFVHYSNNSLSSLDDTVLLDTDKLDETQISYYAISSRSTLTKTSDSYTTENVGTGNLNFKNFVWKISEQRYMLVSNTIVLVVSETSKQSFSNYIELQYIDEGIAYLVNQDGTYSTISSDAYLLLDNGVRIYIGSKNVSDEEQVLVNLTQMVVDSDDNIEVIPDEDYNIESDDQPQIVVNANDGSDGKAGDAGEEGNPGELGNKGNQGTAGSPGTQGNPGNPGENADGYGLQYTAETLPSFALTSDGLETTAYSVKGTILYYANDDITMADDTKLNKDGSLEQGYPATFMIINNDDNEIVWLRNIKLADLNAFAGDQTAIKQINYLTDNGEPVATLKQDTVYTFAISSTFIPPSGGDFITQQVFQQQFTTDTYGMSLSFDYSTMDTLAYTVNISDEAIGSISSFNIELYDNEMNLISIPYNNENKFKVTQTGGLVPTNNVDGIINIPNTLDSETSATVEFRGLSRNTTYHARVNVTTSFDGIATIPSSSFEYVTGKTLKMTPTVGQPYATMSEKTNSFVITPGPVNDYDSGIIGYRYDFYEITMTGSEETYQFVLSYEASTLADISVPVLELPGTKSEKTLYRGCEYVVKQVALFNNNLTVEEIESVYSERFSTSTTKQWPTLQFDLNEYSNADPTVAGMSAASIIDGTLNISDDYNTIPSSAFITIEYVSTNKVNHVYKEKSYEHPTIKPAWANYTYYEKITVGTDSYYALLSVTPNDWDDNWANYYVCNENYTRGITNITDSVTYKLSDYRTYGSNTYSIEFTFDALKSETTYILNAYISELSINGIRNTGVVGKGVLLDSTTTTTAKYNELYISSFSIPDYSLLTSEPSDWGTNYSNYYTVAYTKNADSSAEWRENTYYYEYSYGDSLHEYILTTSQPNDWASKRTTSYYTRSFPNVTGLTAPDFNANLYFKRNINNGSSTFAMNICFSQSPTARDGASNYITFTNNCKNKLGLANSIDLSIKSLSCVKFDVYVGTYNGNSYIPTGSAINKDEANSGVVSYSVGNKNIFNNINFDRHDYASLYKFESDFNRTSKTIGSLMVNVGAYLNKYNSDDTPVNDLSNFYITLTNESFGELTYMEEMINKYISDNRDKNVQPYVFINCVAAYDYTYGIEGGWSDSYSSNDYQIYEVCNQIQIGSDDNQLQEVGQGQYSYPYANSIYDRWVSSNVTATHPTMLAGPYFNLNSNVIYKNVANNSNSYTIDSGVNLLDYIKKNYNDSDNASECISNLYSTFDFADAVEKSKIGDNLVSKINELNSFWVSDENTTEDDSTSGKSTIVGYYIKGPSDWLASRSVAVRYIIYKNIYDDLGNLITQVEITKSYNNLSTESDDETDGWIYYTREYSASHNGFPGYYFFLDAKSIYNNELYGSCDGSISRGEPFSVRMQVKLADFVDLNSNYEVFPADDGDQESILYKYIEENAFAYKQEPKINLIQFDGTTADTAGRNDIFYAYIQDNDDTLFYNYTKLTNYPDWAANTFYSNEIVTEYLPLTKKPANWLNNYANYFVKQYNSLSSLATAPTWKANTYYRMETVGSINTYILLDSEPSEWTSTYTSYYSLVYVNATEADKYTWTSDKYFAKITEKTQGYKLLETKPADWGTTGTTISGHNYYTRSGFSAYDSEDNTNPIYLSFDSYGDNTEDEPLLSKTIGFDSTKYKKIKAVINKSNLKGILFTDYDCYKDCYFLSDGKFNHSSLYSSLSLASESKLTKGVGSITNADFHIVKVVNDSTNNKFKLEIMLDSEYANSICAIDISVVNTTPDNYAKLTGDKPQYADNTYYYFDGTDYKLITLLADFDGAWKNSNCYINTVKNKGRKYSYRLSSLNGQSYDTSTGILTITIDYSTVAYICEESNTTLTFGANCYYVGNGYGTKYAMKTGSNGYYLFENQLTYGNVLVKNDHNIYNNSLNFTGATYEYNTKDLDGKITQGEISFDVHGLVSVPREVRLIESATVDETLAYVFSDAIISSTKQGRNFINVDVNFINFGTILTDAEHLPRIYYRKHVDGDSDDTSKEINDRSPYNTNWTAENSYKTFAIDETKNNYNVVIDGLNYNTYYDFVLVGWFYDNNNQPYQAVLSILDNDDLINLKTLSNLNFDFGVSKLYRTYSKTNRDSKYLCLDIAMNDIYRSDITTGINNVFIDVFTLLQNKPDDWEVSYNYSQLTSETAPTFVAGTYYEYKSGQYYVLTSEPDKWDTDNTWKNYYTREVADFVNYYKVKYTNLTGSTAPVWPLDINDDSNNYMYYKYDGANYVLLDSCPSDWNTNWNSYYLKDYVNVRSDETWSSSTYYVDIASSDITASQFLAKIQGGTDSYTLGDYYYSVTDYDFAPNTNKYHEINNSNEYVARVVFEYSNANDEDRYQTSFIYTKLQKWSNLNENFIRIVGANRVEAGTPVNYKINFTVSGTDVKRIIASDNVDDLNSVVFVAELHEIKDNVDTVVNINNSEAILVKDSNSANASSHKVVYFKLPVSGGMIQSKVIACEYLESSSQYYLKVYACVDETNIERVPKALTEYQLIDTQPSGFNSQDYYVASYSQLDSATAPTWKTNMYYSYEKVGGIDVYTLVESEPTNWNKNNNWKNYYSKSYIKAASGLTWKTNTYYKKMINDFVLLTQEPGDWTGKYGNYYTYNGTNYVKNTNSVWSNNTYYELVNTYHIFNQDTSVGGSTNERNSYNYYYSSGKITTPASGGILVYAIDLIPSNNRITFTGSGLNFIQKIRYYITDLDNNETSVTYTLLYDQTLLPTIENSVELGARWKESDGSSSTYYLKVPELVSSSTNYYAYIEVFGNASDTTPVMVLEGSYTPPTPINTSTPAPMPALTQARQYLNNALSNVIGDND